MPPASPPAGSELPALAFDVYGTLADPGRLADALRDHVADAEALAPRWRRNQLEISWLLSLMQRYEDFEMVTAYALDTALAEAGVALPDAARRDLVARAATLEVYEDVPAALARLERAGCVLAVLSNGSPRMLESSLAAAGIGERFRHVISVDEVRVFKPAPEVYRHAARRLGRPLEDVWLVSGNPFDCAGAKAAGMKVAKVERGPSWSYPFAGPPDLVVATLAGLADALLPTLRDTEGS